LILKHTLTIGVY